MAKAEDKQDTIREYFRVQTSVVPNWRNAKQSSQGRYKMFVVSFLTYPEYSVHGNPFNPFSIMLLTGPHIPSW